MTTHPLTIEQSDVRDCFRTWPEAGILVTAGAGSGKTSTMLALAETALNMLHPTTYRAIRLLYLAFNKSVAKEARGKFPANTHCSTVHAMAYAATGSYFNKRLSGGKRGRNQVGPLNASATKVAVMLGISRSIKCGEGEGARTLQPGLLANLARATVDNFCISADDTIGLHHVQIPDGIPAEYDSVLRRAILPWAHKAWEEIQLTDKQLAALNVDYAIKFKHNHYLKIWQLSRPDLARDYDVILYDEAQDANPCTLAVVKHAKDNGVLVVAVGDSNQAINGWNGAVDSMTEEHFPGARNFKLTKSWRFGPAIADEANLWLAALESDMRIVGNDATESEVGYFPHNPDAILCRTNAGAIAEVIRLLDAGLKVTMVGDVARELKQLVWAAYSIKAGKGTDHADLYPFDTWDEVQAYSEEPAGADLRVFVQLVNMHGTRALINALDGLTGEEDADVTVSTAHRAKGREWDSVAIGPDFRRPVDRETQEPIPMTPEFMMLCYVAITRARVNLYTAGLDFIADYLTEYDLDNVDIMADA